MTTSTDHSDINTATFLDPINPVTLDRLKEAIQAKEDGAEEAATLQRIRESCGDIQVLIKALSCSKEYDDALAETDGENLSTVFLSEEFNLEASPGEILANPETLSMKPDDQLKNLLNHLDLVFVLVAKLRDEAPDEIKAIFRSDPFMRLTQQVDNFFEGVQAFIGDEGIDKLITGLRQRFSIGT